MRPLLIVCALLCLVGCNLESSKTVYGPPIQLDGVVQAFDAGPPTPFALIKTRIGDLQAAGPDTLAGGTLATGAKVSLIVAYKYIFYYRNGEFQNVGYGGHEIRSITVR